jgi:hypothetical protein
LRQRRHLARERRIHVVARQREPRQGVVQRAQPQEGGDAPGGRPGEPARPLARAVAVETAAAAEAEFVPPVVDGAAEVRAQVRAGLAGRLVEREALRRIERQGHAAQSMAGGAIRAQAGRQGGKDRAHRGKPFGQKKRPSPANAGESLW